MENLNLWNKKRRPPKEVLRTIQTGRLKGKSDINPQWRLEAMTELFGPIGVGWNYNIIKVWTENCGDEVAMFTEIQLTYRYREEPEKWSKPITGVGGTKLISKEKRGLYLNDEALKMAVTDALSVAMKQLGIASDVYMGLFDGSKYIDEPEEKEKTIDKLKASRIKKLIDETGTNVPKFQEWVEKITGKKMTSFEDIPESHFQTIIAMLEKKRIKNGNSNDSAG